MAIITNTVRLRAEFKTFAGEFSNPTSITFKVYNKQRVQVGTTVDITADDRISTGIYEYDYTIPTGYTELTYEFSGLLEGKYITGRSTIDCDWT